MFKVRFITNINNMIYSLSVLEKTDFTNCVTRSNPWQTTTNLPLIYSVSFKSGKIDVPDYLLDQTFSEPGFTLTTMSNKLIKNVFFLNFMNFLH